MRVTRALEDDFHPAHCSGVQDWGHRYKAGHDTVALWTRAHMGHCGGCRFPLTCCAARETVLMHHRPSIHEGRSKFPNGAAADQSWANRSVAPMLFCRSCKRRHVSAHALYLGDVRQDLSQALFLISRNIERGASLNRDTRFVSWIECTQQLTGSITVLPQHLSHPRTALYTMRAMTLRTNAWHHSV